MDASYKQASQTMLILCVTVCGVFNWCGRTCTLTHALDINGSISVAYNTDPIPRQAESIARIVAVAAGKHTEDGRYARITTCLLSGKLVRRIFKQIETERARD